MMLVVGGKNSSNTTKLYKVVHKVQKTDTQHIETENDTKPEWFKGIYTVGITGGASTPDFIIDIVERRVKNL